MQMIIDTRTIEQTHGFALSLKSLPFGRASRVTCPAGGVCTPIALHCGSFIFNMAVKAAEFGRF